MVKKAYSYTKSSIRHVKTKNGSRKIVSVKSHINKINRTPKRK